MFCRCFCPGVLQPQKKDIEIEVKGQLVKLEKIEIQKCKNPSCRDGFIASEMWDYITDILGEKPEGMESFRLSRKIFAAFREENR